jgi:hypothetical protein
MILIMNYGWGNVPILDSTDPYRIRREDYGLEEAFIGKARSRHAFNRAQIGLNP